MLRPSDGRSEMSVTRLLNIRGLKGRPESRILSGMRSTWGMKPDARTLNYRCVPCHRNRNTMMQQVQTLQLLAHAQYVF
jgi:hypothetical protein